MLNNYLLEHYKFNDSIKAYKGYKVKSPDETIKTITSAFKKINLEIKYVIKNNTILPKYYPYQLGHAYLHPKENDEIILMKTNGKGVTSILSRASATAEMIERFSGYGLVASGNIGFYLAQKKFNEILNKKAARNKVIKNKFPYHSLGISDYIPDHLQQRYSDMSQSVCYSLTQKKLFCYPEKISLILNGSNGMASGNTFEEATLHGIMEVLERLTALYVLDTLPPCNRISKTSITHPTLKKLVDLTTSIGVEFEMLDLSFLFGIPTIVSIFNHPKWDLPPNTFTNSGLNYPKMIIGVDTDSQDAAMRCYTEFFQVACPIYMAIGAEHTTQHIFNLSKLPVLPIVRDWLRSSGKWSSNGSEPLYCDILKYLKMTRDEIPITDIERLYDINQRIEIERIVDRLKNHNTEVLIEDVTNPILKFPVVRAMLSGGEGYFSKIPYFGSLKIIIGAKNEEEKLSFLRKNIITSMSEHDFPFLSTQIIKDETQCNDYKQEQMLIHSILYHISCTGITNELWGAPINPLLYVGRLFLQMKEYNNAKNCLEAVVSMNFDDIPALLALSYAYSKIGYNEEYKDMIEHIETITKGCIDINKELKNFETPLLNSKQYEFCDLQCEKKTKPELCTQCFYNYMKEGVFQELYIDEYIKKSAKGDDKQC